MFMTTLAGNTSSSADAVGDRSKIDKKRRTEEEAMVKREQARGNCKLLEQHLSEKKQEMDRAKVNIIGQLRELIVRSDQTVKACTAYYFDALNDLCSMRPLQYQSLAVASRAYTPGSEYSQYIRQFASAAQQNNHKPW